jgi:hypothetical protein
MGGGQGRLVRAPALVALAGLVVLAAGGCRATPRALGSGAGAEGASGDPGAAGDERIDREAFLADVVPGPYAKNPRFRALAQDWGGRVERAAARLADLTGLGFSDRGSPHVTLGTSREGGAAGFSVHGEISGGRRRARLVVHAEPLLVRGESPDRVLVEGLASAAVRVGPGGSEPPAWFDALARTLATGDLEGRVGRVARAALDGVPLRVDVDDPAAAEATGLAVAMLLSQESDPATVRRLLALGADGEDPRSLLDRALEAGDSGWPERARRELSAAVAAADVEAERAVRALRAAARDLGPEGLEAAVPGCAGSYAGAHRVQAELDALRLAAALDLGDAARAREVTARRPPTPETLRLLDDPGTYVLLAARAQLSAGGDAAAGRALLRRFDLDFPRHAERRAATELLASVVRDAPPEEQGAILERLVEERALEPAAAALWLTRLLADHRAGEARRLLESLPPQARAEVGEAAEAVERAEAAPSAEALAAARLRVASWWARPVDATARDVEESGRAGAEALLERLPPSGDPRRRTAVALAARAAGVERTVALLAPRWGAAASGFEEDVGVLAAHSGYAELARAVEKGYPPASQDARAQVAWERVLLGIDPEVLAGSDDLLRRARSEEYSERRSAFDEVALDGLEGAPTFLAHFAKDPAALLRREAVSAAGRHNLPAIARGALSDRHWAVRQEACAALLATRDRRGVELLIPLLRTPDPDPRVRAAAAHALIGLGPRDPLVARVLVRQLRGQDEALADDVARRLPLLDAEVAARALVWALSEEVSLPDASVNRAALFRLFVAYRRVSGRDPGYHPSLSLPQVRAMVASLPERSPGAPARAN